MVYIGVHRDIRYTSNKNKIVLDYKTPGHRQVEVGSARAAGADIGVRKWGASLSHHLFFL